MIARVCSLLRMKQPSLVDRGLLFGSGTTVPADGTDGWQPGAIFQHTDGNAGSVLYVNEGTVTSCLFNAVAVGGDEDAFVVGTFSSLEAGSGIPVSEDVPAAAVVYGDDNDLNIGVSVYNFRSRILLTTDQSGGTIRAVGAQLKMIDGVDVATGIYTASQGYLELVGDHESQAGANLSCFSASLEIGSSLTVDAEGEACGLHVETTGTGTITNNGTCAAILIDNAAGAAEWPVGIYMPGPDVTTGLRIGDWIGGAATTHGVMFGADMDVYGDGQLDVMQVHGATSTALTGNYSVKCGRFRHVVNVDDTLEAEAYGLIGQVVAKDVVFGLYAAGLMGTIESNGGFHAGDGVSASYPCMAGVIARPGGSGITVDTGSVLAGFAALSNTNTSVTLADATALYPAVYVAKCQAACIAWSHGLYIADSAATTGISIGNCSTAGITVESDDDKVAGYNAIYSHIDTGGVTGWNAGRVTASRFKVTLDGSGNVGNVSAIWGGLNSGGTYTGLGQATCAAFEVVTTHVGSHPTAILYLTSAPGDGASHATMPYLVFAENPSGTGSNILFEVGSAPAGYTCTTGAGNLYHAETLQIKVNGNARYLPMSTVQTSFTTAYPIILTTTDPATATNGIYSNLVQTATWTGSITPLRCRNTITTAAAGGNCYGGWFNMLFDTASAPTGLGLSCGLYVEAGSNVASVGVSSVLMATLLGDADGAVTTSPILTLADASTLKTNVVMEFGFNAGGTLLGTAEDTTATAFRTGGNAATNIQFKQGLRVMCNGAYYYMGLIAEGDWQND